jgi:phage terminase large subunit-like protein
MTDRVVKLVRGGPRWRPANPKRVERCRASTEEFGRAYLAHHFFAPSAPFHLELDRHFENPASITKVAREHGKTTRLFARLLRAICYREVHYPLVIRATDDEAMRFVSDVRLELETNELLRMDFGDLVGRRKWTEHLFITRGSDICVHGEGALAKVRGIKHRQYRPDWLIIDDLENDEHVESESTRIRCERWFRRALLNTLAPGARITMMGTPLPHSLLQKLCKSGEYSVAEFPAECVADERDGQGKQRIPLWPEMWPIERLDARKAKIGSVAYAQEFMLREASDETVLVKDSWLQFYEPGEIVRLSLEQFLGVDLAIREKKTNDKFAAVTIGITTDGHVYVLSYLNERIPFPAQRERTLHLYRVFRHRRMGIETNAYQLAFKQALDERGAEERLWPPTVEFTRTKSKDFYWQKIAVAAEAGRLHVRHDMTELIDQLTTKSDHDDLVDALEMAMAVAEKRSGPLECYTSGEELAAVRETKTW